jgi:hypothetical protein
MKNRIILLGVLFILLSADAFALQKAFMYVTLGYGRGWFPWSCVVEKGVTGVYGSPMNFCGTRDCPFEAAASYGENNCVVNSSFYTNPTSFLEGMSINEFGEKTRISIPEDLKIVTPDGNVVGDTLCVGDKFTLQKGVNKGEYFNDGGNEDTPAIYWVDDVEALTKKIVAYHDTVNLTCKDIIVGSIPQGTVDSLTGIPVIDNPGSGSVTTMSGGNIVGRLVCNLKEKRMGGSGIVKNGKDYQVTVPGTFDFEATYIAECMYYMYGNTKGFCTEGLSSASMGATVIKMPMVLQSRTLYPGETASRVVESAGGKENVFDPYPCSTNDPVYDGTGGHHNILFNSIEDFFNVGNISLKKTIKVIDPQKGSAQLEVVGADDLRYGSTTNLRVLVKNNGESEITIKRLYASCDNKLLSCDSDKVAVGATAECLISVTPKTGQKPVLILDYEYKSCGKTRSGTVPKTLMESKTVTPKASVQAYSVGVHEGCENGYYGCVPSDREGNFIVGYECYNQNDQFYSAGKERFNLKYELPDLTSKTILGASLTLSLGKVNKPQTLALYSANSDWEPVTCRAGGDICTQPHCGECKELFELSGDRVAETEAKSMGLLSFDISDQIRAAYLSGTKVLSYQVRGEEDLWETGGKGSCGGLNAWSELDVEVQGVGGIQPYLEIVYR